MFKKICPIETQIQFGTRHKYPIQTQIKADKAQRKLKMNNQINKIVQICYQAQRFNRRNYTPVLGNLLNFTG